MPLSETLSKLHDRNIRRNTVEVWLDTLSDEDRKLVIQYLKDTSISSLALIGALKEEGAPFGKDSLIAYRKELAKNVSK